MDMKGPAVFPQPGPALCHLPLTEIKPPNRNRQRGSTLAISAALSATHCALWQREGQRKEQNTAS